MNIDKNNVSRLHIVYLLIIFAIIIIFLIVCFCKGGISEDAFLNVSFAATVSSIILAVLSIIIISLNAANTTAGNLGSISEIEKKLNDSLIRLQVISETLNRTEYKIDKLRVSENIEPSMSAEDADKLSSKSYTFMMVGKRNYTRRKELEVASIKKLCSDLEIEKVQFDVQLGKNTSKILMGSGRK